MTIQASRLIHCTKKVVMFKRLVVAVFATAAVAVPLSAPATAAPAEKSSVVKVVKVVKAKPGTVSTRAIDWE